MHILATTAQSLDETEVVVDLAQTPAEVVVLSFSDSDLAAAAEAWRQSADTLPALRLASLKLLRHPMSVDLYVERVAAHAQAVVVRCLGGLDYWRYGIERLAAIARANGAVFVALPGDDRPDERLAGLSVAPEWAVQRLDDYFRSGGVDNAALALRLIAALVRGGSDVDGTSFPAPVHHGAAVAFAIGEGRQPAPTTERPAALVVFYRSSLLAADTAPVSALMQALWVEGLSPTALAVTSLKDPAAAREVLRTIVAQRPSVILNATAFSAQGDDGTSVLDAADAPVLQVVMAQGGRDAWAASARGLSPSDLAMNVALTELDGRLLSRAISWKGETPADPRLEYASVGNVPDPGRVGYVAKLAAAWARLRDRPRASRRVAVVLSDYPARGGRAGYAVGLDTAQSAAAILEMLRAAGFETGEEPGRPAAVDALLRGDTTAEIAVPLAEHERYLAALPDGLREEIDAAWGRPADDPSCSNGVFRFPVLRAGNVVVVLQPGRGERGDRKAAYHDVSLPPRHAYVALYAHLRTGLAVDALVHLGTHGTLEWLPGKALALSERCWPEVVLGPVPVIYPFIVNNPGEAMQAKRRLAAVTIGHLTPPLSAAGLYGALAELEGLVDEYAEADGLDRRRRDIIEREIVARAWATGLAAECGLEPEDGGRAAIAKLDAHLCDIKDLAVRERLHVFGTAPDPEAAALLSDAIVAASGADGTALAERVPPLVAASGACERRALLAALDGRRVAPGPAGAPSRGRADVLPTGRNLTSMDPRAIPTRTATAIGVRAADEAIRRYLQDHGDYPRALMIDLWASASLRTGGDDLAQALAYLGVRPVWDPGSTRIAGIEVLPLAKLGRPRIDATLRVSGLFRDVFEGQIALYDLAVQRVAVLDEDDADNPLAAARRRGESLARIYGAAPGGYGARAADAALSRAWASRGDLGRAYLDGATHAFGAGSGGVADGEGFLARVRAADALVHPQDDRERDLLDGEEVADFAGGFAAAAEILGRRPALLHVDTSRPEAPRARSFDEEIARVVRGRVTNPRWIAGMLAHGHRGGAELAQAVDALYAFAATTDAVPSHLVESVHEAILGDEGRVATLAESNPDALRSIAGRLADLVARGLWTPRRNAARDEIARALRLAGQSVEARRLPAEAAQ